VATVDSPDFWNDLYARPRQPWELGGPTPTLVDFVESTPPPRGRIVVPGCGRGHDVRYLTHKGYNALGVDFSPTVVDEARALARDDHVDASFVEMDIFDLAHPYTTAFDGAWEYTCYCAIDPARRAQYVDVLASIVRPGGWLLACFFPIVGDWVGPPYPVDVDEARALLARSFSIVNEFAPTASPKPRRGLEWMMYARRTP
jgi:methyl halide transferase